MIDKTIALKTQQAIEELYSAKTPIEGITIQKTIPIYKNEGDFTVVVFPFTMFSHKAPEQTGNEIGEYLKKNISEITSFHVVKGFLNLTIDDAYWCRFYQSISHEKTFGFIPEENKASVVIEYSSPNTNKPLHLGHIRNNLLGFSIAEILKACGRKVIKTTLVNDRGIHICKSMVAWQKWGQGETPESSDMKGDHLVGKYYVLFDKHYKDEIKAFVKLGMKEEEAAKQVPLVMEARDMLRKWEAKDKEVIKVWKMMNGWVYKGFDETYQKLGINFDKTIFESDTYLLGKQLVEEGLKNKILIQKADKSIWIDLTAEGLDEKILLRADGTSVYITQDLGTAKLRQDEYNPEKLIYVVGNEQNYHFDVLKLILKKLGYEWSDKIYHLSYGMVELPEGKMKSREGTVVDADELMDEMFDTARQMTEELGKIEDFNSKEAEDLYRKVSLGALKYFMLKVDPAKNMMFNPKESIDFNGNTGPFVQYTYARVQSMIRKSGFKESDKNTFAEINLHPKEKEIIKLLYDFPETIRLAGEKYSPAFIANYAYELAKEFNQYYHEVPIIKETDKNLSAFRIELAYFTGQILKNAFALLGIEMPDKM